MHKCQEKKREIVKIIKIIEKGRTKQGSKGHKGHKGQKVTMLIRIRKGMQLKESVVKLI
jgi:hypothetical protein